MSDLLHKSIDTVELLVLSNGLMATPTPTPTPTPNPDPDPNPNPKLTKNPNPDPNPKKYKVIASVVTLLIVLFTSFVYFKMIRRSRTTIDYVQLSLEFDDAVFLQSLSEQSVIPKRSNIKSGYREKGPATQGWLQSNRLSFT